MRPSRYAAVAALVAAAAMSGCGHASQTTGGQPAASIAAPTALSSPSGQSGVGAVATAPAPPPTSRLPSPLPATSSPPLPATSSAPAPSGPPAPTSPPDQAVPTQSGPPGGDQPGPNGQLYSKHAAQLRLDADLASLHLPPGAVRQSTPLPAAVRKESESIGMETAALDTWWSVPGTAADVTAYLKSHPPTGFGVGGSATTIVLHGEALLEFVALGAAGPQTVYNAGIAQDGDHVDVRVQLEVGYLPTRTAVETIPASVTSGTAVYQPPNRGLPNNATPAPRRSVTLSATEVRLVAAALNPVDAMSRLAHSCPSSDGEEAWVTLRYAGHTVVFDAYLGGCGSVMVTSDGVAQPDLALTAAVSTALRKAMHVTKAENPFVSVSQ